MRRIGIYSYTAARRCKSATSTSRVSRGNSPTTVSISTGCKRVTVSGCIIDVGDDALTLRANEKRLKEKRPCEDVTVTGCVLCSRMDYAIRIGVGAGKIRNCLVFRCPHS